MGYKARLGSWDRKGSFGSLPRDPLWFLSPFAKDDQDPQESFDKLLKLSPVFQRLEGQLDTSYGAETSKVYASVIDITADGLEVFCKALQGSEQNINSAPVKYSMALALRNSNKKTNQDMEKAITAFRSERSQHDPAIYPSLVAGVLDGDVDLTKMVQRMLEKTAMRMSVK